MSAKVMGQVWELALPANQMMVLLAMADHADHNGQNIFPGVPLLAWKTGYSVRQVRNIIGALIQIGLLRETAAPGGKVKVYAIEFEHGIRKSPRPTKKHGRPQKTPAKITPVKITGEIQDKTPAIASREVELNHHLEPKDISPMPEKRMETEEFSIAQRDSVILAWSSHFSISPPKMSDHRNQARIWLELGYTADDLSRYMKAVTAKGCIYHDRPLDFDKALSNAKLWLAEQEKPQPVRSAAFQAQRPRDVWYDMILEVFCATGAQNGLYRKMLLGTATAKGWKEFNLEKPLTTPEELKAWAVWYKRQNSSPHMVKEPVKVQSSIGYWQSLPTPRIAPKAEPLPVLETPPTGAMEYQAWLANGANGNG